MDDGVVEFVRRQVIVCTDAQCEVADASSRRESLPAWIGERPEHGARVADLECGSGQAAVEVEPVEPVEVVAQISQCRRHVVRMLPSV